MMGAYILLCLILILAGLVGQIMIHRAPRIPRNLPTVPPPNPSQAFEYGLPWVCADGTILTGPPVTVEYDRCRAHIVWPPGTPDEVMDRWAADEFASRDSASHPDVIGRPYVIYDA